MKRRVMIIEDDEIFLRPLRRTLEVAGFEVLAAPSGEEGMDVLKGEDVDLVLVMSVNPGFGGQAYLAWQEAKVAELRQLIVARGLDVDIEVDGGIAPSTIAAATTAGAGRVARRRPDRRHQVAAAAHRRTGGVLAGGRGRAA